MFDLYKQTIIFCNIKRYIFLLLEINHLYHFVHCITLNFMFFNGFNIIVFHFNMKFKYEYHKNIKLQKMMSSQYKFE